MSDPLEAGAGTLGLEGRLEAGRLGEGTGEGGSFTTSGVERGPLSYVASGQRAPPRPPDQPYKPRLLQCLINSLTI